MQKSHASSWKYRKLTWPRTRLRNKPTLIESVHRDTGKRATHLYWPGYLVCLEGSGSGQASEAGSEQLPWAAGLGGRCGECRAEARAHVSLCVHVCVQVYTWVQCTQDLQKPSKANLGRGSGRRHLKSPKAPRLRQDQEGHVIVCAECPDLTLLLPLVGLLCDPGRVTYPLWALDSLDNH